MGEARIAYCAEVWYKNHTRRPHRLTVRTAPSHGVNRGSIPREVTTYKKRKNSATRSVTILTGAAAARATAVTLEEKLVVVPVTVTLAESFFSTELLTRGLLPDEPDE